MLLRTLYLSLIAMAVVPACTPKDKNKTDFNATNTAGQSTDIQTRTAAIDELKSQIASNQAVIDQLRADETASAEKISELEKENAELIGQVTAQELALNEALSEKRKLEAEKLELTEKIAELKAKLQANSAASSAEALRLKTEIATLEAQVLQLKEKLAKIAADDKPLNDLIAVLKAANKQLRDESVQKFLYGLRKNRLFVAGGNELADRFLLPEDQTCHSVLGFAGDTTLRDVARVPAGYKLDYHRILICTDGQGRSQMMHEQGVLTNFLGERSQVILLVAEQQSCQGEDGKSSFGGYAQSFQPYTYAVGGYETVNLWPPLNNDRSNTVEHNMASTLPGVFAESCQEALNQADTTANVRLACLQMTGQPRAQSTQLGCFTAGPRQSDQTAPLTFTAL